MAVRLYERSGFSQVRRTDTGACHCLASRVLDWFLGHPGELFRAGGSHVDVGQGWCLHSQQSCHDAAPADAPSVPCTPAALPDTGLAVSLPLLLPSPVWIKMKKDLPAPAHLAAAAPAQQGMVAALATPAAATAPDADASFVSIPLDSPEIAAAAARLPQQPGATGAGEPAPISPGGSLLHKLGLGFMAMPACQGSGIAGKAAAASATPGVTPRIAAVGTGPPAGVADPALQPSSAGSTNGSQQLALHAPSQQVEQGPCQRLRQQRLAALKQQVQEPTTGAASAASTSVASFALDTDSEAEEAGSHSSFELVELSTASAAVMAGQV